MVELYYLFLSGQVQGPFHLLQLQKMRNEGGVGADTLVRSGLDGAWVRFADLFEEEIEAGHQTPQITEDKDLPVSRFMAVLEEQERMQQQEVRRGITILDLVVCAVLWWWAVESEWTSARALAVGYSGVLLGGVMMLASEGILCAIGMLVLGLGQLLSFGGSLWLLWDVLGWLIRLIK